MLQAAAVVSVFVPVVMVSLSVTVSLHPCALVVIKS